MKLRFLFLALSIAIFSLSSSAQSSGFFKAGANLANISTTNDGDIDENNALLGFQIGFVGDVKLTSLLYLQPGLSFSTKGSKTESGNPSGLNYYKATSNPSYIEVPLTLILKTPKADVRFFGGVGPYVGIGIGGKNKADGKVSGIAFHSEDKIEWSNDDPFTWPNEEGAGYGILRRFDFGLNGTLGIETKEAVFSLNYGLGLAKLQSGSNNSADDRNKHRVLSLTIGFRL